MIAVSGGMISVLFCIPINIQQILHKKQIGTVRGKILEGENIGEWTNLNQLAKKIGEWAYLEQIGK